MVYAELREISPAAQAWTPKSLMAASLSARFETAKLRSDGYIDHTDLPNIEVSDEAIAAGRTYQEKVFETKQAAEEGSEEEESPLKPETICKANEVLNSRHLPLYSFPISDAMRTSRSS